MKRKFLFIFALLALLVAPQPAAADGPVVIYLPMILKPSSAPQLKWAYGGCYNSWCETGWYSSPAAVDVNNDGVKDVVASAYSLVALDGSTGALLWRAGDTSRRTWPGIAVADLERNGAPEIIIAQHGGVVSVYNLNGTLKWQKTPTGTTGELRGLLVEDLDGNNSSLEVLVTRASGGQQNTWVLDSAGNTRSGWPRLPLPSGNTTGEAAGVYNANPAAGNLSGDARKEIVVPSDVHYINVYEPDGSAVMANAAVFGSKQWGLVGVWESQAIENRGWGECDGVRTESYRTNFADGPATLSDVNGDGTREVIVTGNMYDCTGIYISRYMAVHIFNADRTRFNSGGYNWNSIPVDTGAPLSEDYSVIESVAPNPVAADLDGDGKKEILYASYDGRLHAFWLDKTEHGSWPFAVTKPGDGFISFASEPLVVDIDNNGQAEVIFTSWTQHGSGSYGRLFVLNWDGSVIYQVNLPAPKSVGEDWNGGLGAPTLANVDGDPDYELIVNTANAGVVVYDLPGSAGARIVWGTGRANQQRTGSN